MDYTQKGMDFLCSSKNSKQIYYDPISSHAATHFKDAPQLKGIVTEVLTNTDLLSQKVEFDIDLGKIVGNTDVVDVDATDELIYAKRKNRDEYVPFTNSREVQPTQLVSMRLILRDDGAYELTSAWFGEFDSPPFPSKTSATREGINFWNKHAFVWGSQGVQEDTITKNCPW